MAKQTGYRGSVKGEAGRTAGERNVVAASKGKKVVPPSDKILAEDEKDLLADEQAADGQSVGHAAAPGLADSTTFTAMMAGAAAAAEGAGAEKSEKSADAGGGGIGVLPIILGVAAIGGGVAAAGGGGSGGSSGSGSQPKPNAAPVVANAIADQTSAEDAAWSFVVPSNAFSDPDGNALTLTATLADGAALPSWLTFNASTRTFSGTPPKDYNGALELKVAASDGTLSVSDVFKLTVTPLNDAPVVTSAAAAAQGSVSEAGHADDGAAVAGVASATGTLTSSDVDAGATKAWSVVGAADAAYGQFAVNAQTGVWTYTLDNTLAATQALKEGETKTLTYTVRVTDDQGAYADQAVTVTVNGTNDKPVVTNAATAAQGIVTTAGNLDDGTVVTGVNRATGALTASDVDANASKAWSVVGTSDATYGQFAVNADTGVWTYTLDNTLAATQALKEGETKTLTYTVRVTDDKGAYADQAVTVTVNGANDVPLVTNTAAAARGAVSETGHLDDGTVVAGVASATGTLTSSDVDANATKAWSVVGTSDATYGSFAVNAETGVWTYTLDNTLAATQALKEGETKTLTYTVRVTDDQGAYADQAVTVTVNGTNDVPVIADMGAVTGDEDSTGIPFTVSGSDVDASDQVTFTAPLVSEKGGAISGGPNGQFTYVPLPDFHGTDSVVVTATDRYGAQSTKVVTFTVISNINEVQSVDFEGKTFEANGSDYTFGDNFKFTDDSTRPTDVTILNFAPGDTIEVTGASADYSFTTLGNDVIINGPTEGGINAGIILRGAAAGITKQIYDEDTAEDALGWNFFNALTNPDSGQGGIAGQGGNLDIDNDQNVLTAALVDARTGDISFTEDANVANNVEIVGFGVGDSITASNALADTYSFTSQGTDLLISGSKAGVSSTIKLVGVVTNGDVYDLATANAAVGFEFFKLQSPSLPAQNFNIDNGEDFGVDPLDAAGASYTFLDDATKDTNVVIINFTSDDIIKVTGSGVGPYSFTTGEDVNDLFIVNELNASIIILDNAITDPLAVVFNYDTAVSAVGFDFMVFG